MIKNFQSIIYLIFILSFLFLITYIYFSSENVKNTNKIRSTYKGIDVAIDLVLLENNTKNIIEYTDEVEEYKDKKKKYKFFELLENNR